MGWSIGYDTVWNRDIGYGVPAYCDHPGCDAKIDRGLSYVCGSEPYGGEHGCGLYFCTEHLSPGLESDLCERCLFEKPPFEAKKDHGDWIQWKLTDESWAEWRKENAEWVQTHK